MTHDELMRKVDEQAKGVIALGFVLNLHRERETAVFISETQDYKMKKLCQHCMIDYPCQTVSAIEIGLE
jgi:hypothetical protein